MIQQFNSWIYIAKEYKHTDSKRHCTPNVQNSTIYNCQIMKARSDNTHTHTHTHTEAMEYYAILKKN